MTTSTQTTNGPVPPTAPPVATGGGLPVAKIPAYNARSFPFAKFLQPGPGIEPGTRDDNSFPTFRARLADAGRGAESIVVIRRSSAAGCHSHEPLYSLPADLLAAVVANPAGALIATPVSEKISPDYVYKPVEFFAVRSDTISPARTVLQRERDKTPTPQPVYIPISSDGLTITPYGTCVEFSRRASGATVTGRKTAGRASVDFARLIPFLGPKPVGATATPVIETAPVIETVPATKPASPKPAGKKT